MNQPLPFDLERVFLVVGIVFAIQFASALYFWLSKDYATKKRLLPLAAAAVGIGFFGVLVVAGFPARSLLPFALLIGVGAFLQVRAVQFCSTCGATVMNRLLWSRAKYCPKCGASLAQS